MSYISYKDILPNLRGLKKGDIVYVISDVLELAKVSRIHTERFDAQCFLNSIMEKVGEEGTVLFPVFSWGFCEGKLFDYRKTPGETGALGNAALKNEKFKRTTHPIYSFAVWGKLQNEICGIETEDSFGEGTIFDYLYKHKAKALVIGLSALEGLTMVHYVEQIVGVSYRFFKKFEGRYVDAAGHEQNKHVVMYVRDLNIDPEENMERLSQILEELKISDTQIINGVPFRTVLLAEACQIIKLDIELNDSRNLYQFKNGRLNCDRN